MAGKNLKKMTRNDDLIPEQESEIKLSDTVFNEDGETKEYDLEAGYIDENNVTHKTFTLREMNGKDEEAISKNEIRANQSKVISVLLSRCCLSIGTLTKAEVGIKKWEQIIQDLTVGDQDIMFLKLREISVGDEFEVVHKCPNCGTELRTFIKMDELETVPFSGERTIPFCLPKGYTDKKGNVHREGVMRLPLGKDREILTPLLNKNVAKARTVMLTRLCKFNSGFPITDDVMSSLTYKDRNYLQELTQELLFGIKSTVDVTCVNCGEEFEGNLNPQNFM